MAFEVGNASELQFAAMALQGTAQKVLLHFFHIPDVVHPRNQLLGYKSPMLGDMLNRNINFHKEVCGEGIPVVSLHGAKGGEVLTDDVEMKPTHGWHMDGKKVDPWGSDRITVDGRL